MARLIRDYRGQDVRLTDERLQHIFGQHPEVARLGVLAIESTLRHPDAVIVSSAADKHLCVVVKSVGAFVITAYVTVRQKQGVRVWPATT